MPMPSSKPRLVHELRRGLVVGERLLPGGAVAAVVVDQQVAGDRQQPGAQAGPLRVEAVPRLEGALERRLGEVLGLLA